MERKDCDENFVSLKVCEERHKQLFTAHEDKHGAVVEKLKSHAKVLDDVDKEVSENFARVHQRIDEFSDTIADVSSEVTSFVNKEVKELFEKVNNIQDRLKNMVIYILISILISVVGAVTSFVISDRKNPETELAKELKTFNAVAEKLTKQLEHTEHK